MYTSPPPARVSCAGLALLLAGLGAAACATLRFPASGQIAGQTIQTTVDSSAARDYLAGGGAHPRSGLREDAAAALAAADGRPLSSDALAVLTRAFSADFAALYFLERLDADPRNRALRRTFESRLAEVRRQVAEGAFVAPPGHRRYLFAFVPGLGYRTDPSTGADFARQRRLLEWAGYATVLIETDDGATVEANATIVAREALRLAAGDRPIVLVSASKGGPEVALALGSVLEQEETRPVRAWVSVGGLLRGSPYADWAAAWPRRWIAAMVIASWGLDPAVLESLTTERRRPAFEALRLPPHILAVQYVGVPLSGHVAGYAEHRYNVIRQAGPNDGLTLLADAIIPGSLAIADVGLDHYFRDPEIDVKTLALAGVLLDRLEAGPR